MTRENKVAIERTPVILRSPADYTRGRVFQLNGSRQNFNLVVATGETRRKYSFVEAELVSPAMGVYWANVSLYSPFTGTYGAAILEIREGMLG